MGARPNDADCEVVHLEKLLLLMFIAGLAAIAPETRASAKGVNLRVAERLGVPRTQECVRSGVPFPKGALVGPEQVSLSGPDGEVAVDTAALARWDHGSVKWLLVNFPATVGASSAVDYSLEYGDGVRGAKPGGLAVNEAADAYEVDTGALRFTIDRKKFGVLRNAEVKDRRGAWVRVSTEGIDLCAKNHACRDYRPRAGKYQVESEEKGDSHAVFKITGTLDRGTQGTTPAQMDYTCRVFCSANSASVKITFTLQNRRQETQEIFRTVDLIVRSDAEADKALVGWPGSKPKELPLAARARIATIQTGPTNLKPWKRFLYAVVDDPSGNVLHECDKSAGWAASEGKSGGVCASIRRMWEKHPKGFVIEPGAMSVSLHPLQGDYFVFPQGMDCTDDVLLTFYAAGDRKRAVNASLGFQDALFACASGEWYCASGAMGRLSPVNEQDSPRYEKLVRMSFDGLMRERDAQRQYGSIDFGDTSGDYTSEPDYWLNQEYDTPHCCYLLFARSGELDYLRWGEDAARHQMDIDTIHYSTSNPHAIGAQYKHDWAHTTQRDHNSGAHREAIDHLWAEGICDHYLLTGDPRALEVAQEIGDYLVRKFENEFNSSRPRAYGWPLIALCGIHQTTGDKKHLDAAARIANEVLAKAHPTRGIWQNSWGTDEAGNELLGNKTFMVGVLMEGMSFYHMITADQEVAAWLAKTARTICDECWVEKDKGFYYTPSLGDRDRGRTTDLRELLGLAYAYSLSHDPVLMKIALTSFDAGQDALTRQWAGKAISGKAFSTFTRSTPRFVALVSEMGTWTNDGPAER